MSETPDSPSQSSAMRYALGGMIAMAVAMGIGRFVYTPILPGMMEALGISASDAGLIASVNYLGYLVGAILAAGGWGQGREHMIMVISLLTSAVLAAAMGLTESQWLFLAIRFLAGVASAFVMVFLSTIVFSRLAVAGRPDLQAVHFGGVGLGIMVSAALTAIVYLSGAGWAANWFWSGALSIAGFLGVILMVREGPASDAPTRREPPLVKSAALTKLTIAYGLFGAGYIVTATFLVAIVRDGDAGPLFESAVWLATGLAGAPSVFIWGRVARKFGLTATFAIGCIVEAVGVLASVSLGGYIGPLLGGMLLGGTFIAVTALGLQAGRVLAGPSPRRALAIMTAAFGTGQILGPIFAGYGADWTGSFTLPSVGASLILLAAGWIAWESGRQKTV